MNGISPFVGVYLATILLWLFMLTSYSSILGDKTEATSIRLVCISNAGWYHSFPDSPPTCEMENHDLYSLQSNTWSKIGDHSVVLK